MPKSTSVQNLKFQINQKGSPDLQIWPLGLYHTLSRGYFVICAPLPPNWTEEKEERKRMEGMEGG